MRNNKGFTLVEMAIVLIIIGIILGAVVKGQDLLSNARAKQLGSALTTWNALTFAYVDRYGRFPGDQLRNGSIGDQVGEQTPALSAIGEMTNPGVMSNAPTNPAIIGGQSFWVYIGSEPAAVAGTRRNLMVVCGTQTCGAGFTTEQTKIIEAVDTAIDGLANAGRGRFRAATAVTLTGGVATVNTNFDASVVTAVTGVSETVAGADILWNAAANRRAVWMFDTPY